MVFRCGQSSRLLTIAAAVASGQPRTLGLTAAPSSVQIALTCMPICVPLCPFNPFPFLILIGCFATLEE